MLAQTISHHRIVEKLGGGGGMVSFIEDTDELGRLVALNFCALGNTENGMMPRAAAFKTGHLNPC